MKLEEHCTLVVGVDERYFRQLETTFQLWLKNWSKLRDVEWLFFYDGRCPELKERIERLIEKQVHRKPTRVQAWLPPDADQYEDQRDRMLTAWSLLPGLMVRTPYWLKLDVDAYPVRQIAGSFPLQRWFESSPAIIGHAWGYTKQRGSNPQDWFERLDQWGDKTKLMQGTERLNMRFNGAKRLSHKRIASFIAFFSTAFTAAVAEECLSSDPNFTIPIPSQDTFLWYCAERMNQPIVRVRMKKHGFTNQSNFTKLQSIVQELSK